MKDESEVFCLASSFIPHPSSFRKETPMIAGSLQRIRSISATEPLHIVRDPMTLFLAVFIPILELFLFGYAVNTNVRDVRTVILDQARTQESRAVLRRFENSHDFKVVCQVDSDKELSRAIVAGRA